MQSNLLLIEKYNRLQVSLLIILSLFFIGVILLNPSILTYYFQYYLLLITVTIIGIPHGFFDYSVAERLFKNHINWVYYFTAGYISLSLIYLLFWIYYPIASLIFFLMISIFHFGIEELNRLQKIRDRFSYFPDLNRRISLKIMGGVTSRMNRFTLAPEEERKTSESSLSPVRARKSVPCCS